MPTLTKREKAGMALSRLALIVAAASGALSSDNEAFFAASERSLTVQKIYTHNHALTFFVNSNHAGNVLELVFTETNAACFSDHTIRFGRHNDPDHAEMHQTADDYDQAHVHLIKDDYSRITLSEFYCFMRFLKEMEASAGHCADGKSNCVVTHEDAGKMVREYERYSAAAVEEEPKSLAKKP